MESAESVEWRAAGRESLLWARYDDEYVVYHRPSGKTHYVNMASALLLQSVLVEPKTAAVAAEQLGVEQSAAVDSEFVERVGQLLVRFEELGLVVRV